MVIISQTLKDYFQLINGRVVQEKKGPNFGLTYIKLIKERKHAP